MQCGVQFYCGAYVQRVVRAADLASIIYTQRDSHGQIHIGGGWATATIEAVSHQLCTVYVFQSYCGAYVMSCKLALFLLVRVDKGLAACNKRTNTHWYVLTLKRIHHR